MKPHLKTSTDAVINGRIKRRLKKAPQTQIKTSSIKLGVLLILTFLLIAGVLSHIIGAIIYMNGEDMRNDCLAKDGYDLCLDDIDYLDGGEYQALGTIMQGVGLFIIQTVQVGALLFLGWIFISREQYIKK